MERELSFQRALSLNNDLIHILEKLNELDLHSEDAKHLIEHVREYVNQKLRTLENSKIRFSDAPASINQNVTIEIEE